MLPEILSGSYKRYKEDTNVFATWLSKTAKACGYKPSKPANQDATPPPPSQNTTPATQGSRLKGKARKEAKMATKQSEDFSDNSKPASVPIMKYTVTTKDLLDQATVVAKSIRPRVQMPSNILRVVQRAIHARQRCADWFRTTGAKGDSSTEGHDHFISVLQKALVILESCLETGSKEFKTSVKGRMNEQIAPEISTSSDDLGNRFDMLEVEDTDDVLDLAASDISAAKKTLPSTVQHTCDVFELETQRGADLEFSIYCFFEDLHRIQDFLKETWKMNKAGTLDLVTAAMTTDMALDLVRRAEEDIIAAAPGLLAKPRSYEAISLIIFYADSFSKGDDPEEKLKSSDTLKLTEFDEFIYLSTARILMKFERVASFKVVEYPQPVPPVRCSYISRPELLELPEVKKWENDDRCLSQLLMDMSCHDMFRDIARDREVTPVEDELSNGLLKLRKEGEVSVWIVFASKVFLDIQDILGRAVGQCYQELRDAAVSANTILDLHVEGEELVPGGSGERWLTRDAAQVLNLHNILTFWIIDNTFPELKEMILAASDSPSDKLISLEDVDQETREHIMRELRAKGRDVDDGPSQEHIENAKRLDLRIITPATDPSFLFLQNPLYSGTLAFNLVADMEEVGITLANHHLTIFAISHLYNALQRMGILETRWPEMDHLIKLQIKPLFAGQLPTTPKEFHSRFSLQLGYSTRNFAQGASYSLIRAASKKKRPLMARTPTSNIFRRYFDGKDTTQECLYRLETLIKESQHSEKPKHHPKTHTTPLELLTQVRDWLPRATPDMRINYVTLTRTCNTLLRRVRARIHQRLGILYKETKHDDSNQPAYLVMILHVLAEASELQYFNDEVVRRKGPPPEGPQLAIAGDVMKGFLEGGGGVGGGDVGG